MRSILGVQRAKPCGAPPPPPPPPARPPPPPPPRPPRRRSKRSLFAELVALDDDCFAHAAANAHGCKTNRQVTLHHFVQQGGRDTAARRTNRVAECNRTAVDIDLIHIKAQRRVDCTSLCRKRLIRLDQLKVRNRQASTCQRLLGGLDRANTHNGRVAANRAVRTNLRQRLQAVRLYIPQKQ